MSGEAQDSMPLPSISDYPYTRLSTSSPTVRLFRLQHDSNGHIIGWLEQFSLSSTSCPKFSTLSYVWGPKTYSHTILINNHPFSVLSSLYPILQVICDNESFRQGWWWIDSVCINQKEEAMAETERNSQVQMMRMIYERSERTVGWIGQGDPEGEEGMRFLKVLLREKKRLQEREVVRLREGGRWDVDAELGPELCDRGKWAALETFMMRPWWTRVWTLQEYIVPKQFVFLCGKESMDRKDLNLAMTSISECRKIDESLLSAAAFEAAWIRRRVLMWYQKGLSMHLTGLMAYISEYKATDPKDRIYSVLGLAVDRHLADPPRYQDSVVEVYTNLAKAFVKHYGSLDVICLADRFSSYAVDPPVQPTLPSWVPDWRVYSMPWMVAVLASQSGKHEIGNLRPIQHVGSNHDVYAAGKTDVLLNISFSIDSKTLTCQGIFVDLVDGIGGLKVTSRDPDRQNSGHGAYECVQSTSSRNDLPSTSSTRSEGSIHTSLLSGYLDTVARCILLNRTDRYLSYDVPPEPCYYEFQTLCLAAINTPSRVHPQFLDWFNRNRSLHIRHHALEQICIAAKPLQSMKKINFTDIMGHEDTFLARFRDTTEWMTRRLMTTESGLLGMVPHRARKGDAVVVLLGCSIPLVLRRWEDGKEGWQLIGECYLHGYMNGEVMERVEKGELIVQEICLS